MGKIACFFGLHDWAIERRRDGKVKLGVHGQIIHVDGEVRVEVCTSPGCGAERGVIDTGTFSEEIGAQFARRMMTEADDERRRERENRVVVANGRERRESRSQFIQKSLEERDKRVAAAAVAKYIADQEQKGNVIDTEM